MNKIGPFFGPPCMSPEKEGALGLPQQNLRLVADSNRWNANGKLQNCEAEWYSRILSQLDSDNVIAQLSVTFSQFAYQEPNSKNQNMFSNLWQHGRGRYHVTVATENL